MWKGKMPRRETCACCGQMSGAPEWKAHTYTMWANQHGRKVRIFCKECGAWTDKTWYESEGKNDVVDVVNPPNNAPYNTRRLYTVLR